MHGFSNLLVLLQLNHTFICYVHVIIHFGSLLPNANVYHLKLIQTFHAKSLLFWGPTNTAIKHSITLHLVTPLCKRCLSAAGFSGIIISYGYLDYSNHSKVTQQKTYLQGISIFSKDKYTLFLMLI